ncbi:CRISPR system precrRNA processing endoribonuclease RAMP protein Cas6 [Limnohabitans sp. Rim8]|uniref:CRISPR system precrRNA processing endoribonuclease RAMP protein Cas6 n=1 Tax=Limnohabitans sp. Rim8 TaxID=1100718 RepID=UPI002635B307|nr:CRISPR system precrRNA processing endoribonuclease RAMP protein Cas6 [Limnohabitans sp. Rim8]
MPPVHPVLTIGLYALDFANTESHPPPHFAGNHWRGALGHALRDLACITGARTCEGCRQTHACAYAYLFETPLPAGSQKMRRYDRAPHPFTLRETIGPAGVRLVMSLFGRGNTYLPLMVLALRRAALSPRGIGGRRMTLEMVCQARSDQAHIWTRIDEAAGTLAPLAIVPTHHFPDCPCGIVELQLLAPLRVKRDGQLVTVDNFRFADFFGNLLRRISMLTYFHTETPFETDFQSVMAQARGIPCDATLKWTEQTRHSSRQKQKMPFGGLAGTIRLAGTDIAPIWPILWLGQYTHAGGGTTMGLGHYTLASLSLPPPSLEPA